MNSDKYDIFIITSNDTQKRIDNVIRKLLPDMSLKAVFKAIRNGDIRINKKKVKQNYKLNEGDELAIFSPFLKHKKEESNNNFKLDSKRVIYESSDILIYNKKRGELVHGERDSLDKRVKSYLKNKIINTLSFSPGPLHRLDRNTQGLIVFSVSLLGARTFTKLLKDNKIQKFYLTIVDGEYYNKETWNDSLERDEKSLKSYKSDKGQKAVTIFTPLLAKKGKTLSLIEIKTGRTHQIRAHCSIHKRPLTGDIKYNKRTDYKEYFLSAISLSFNINSAILDKRTFTLPIERKIHPLLNQLFSDSELRGIEAKIRELTTG